MCSLYESLIEDYNSLFIYLNELFILPCVSVFICSVSTLFLRGFERTNWLFLVTPYWLSSESIPSKISDRSESSISIDFI